MPGIVGLGPFNKAEAHSLLAISLSFSAASSFAATITYTDSASFLGSVSPGAYSNSFTGLANPGGTSTNFSGGGFSYTASSPGGLYLAGGFLGTNLPNTSLVITFTSGNVTALGALFYNTNISDAFQAALVSLSLSDGTSVTFTPTSTANAFRGFTSTSAITSLTMAAPTGAGLYAGLDNLVVGTAATATVPEPGSLALVGLAALAGFAATGRRRT